MVGALSFRDRILEHVSESGLSMSFVSLSLSIRLNLRWGAQLPPTRSIRLAALSSPTWTRSCAMRRERAPVRGAQEVFQSKKWIRMEWTWFTWLFPFFFLGVQALTTSIRFYIRFETTHRLNRIASESDSFDWFHWLVWFVWSITLWLDILRRSRGIVQLARSELPTKAYFAIFKYCRL